MQLHCSAVGATVCAQRPRTKSFPFAFMRFCGEAYVHMLDEQATGVGGYGRPEDEYASENTKKFTVDSLLQIRRPDTISASLDDKRGPIASYNAGMIIL